ncbi:MAG: HIT domain-containing protein, partial [Candidatus Faecousia sp.]|nr:HIT domain-containing protein [Candidatus Faecousia sp.]
LVVPKAHLDSAARITEENAPVVGHIFAVIAKLAGEMGFSDGFRVVTNCGQSAGQTVHHLHFHVLAGKELGSFH